MSKIILKNVKLIKEDEQILSNINLEILSNENIVFVPETNNDIRSVQALIRIIAGIYQVSNGTISYETNDHRILIGYKNLEHLFNRDLLVTDLLNTLIHTQKVDDENLKEIKEMLEMFRIEKKSSTKNLEHIQKNLLNLLTLLIIKPSFILVDHLSLPGSVMMQLTILEFIKQYCARYNISLIISSNDDDVIDAVANRVITLNNSKITNDLVLNKVNNQMNKDVDNKTKSYDLEDDILAALNNNSNYKNINNRQQTNSLEQKQKNFIDNHQKNSEESKQYYKKVDDVKQVDQELIYQVTKALDESFEDEIILSMKTNDDLVNEITNSFNNFSKTSVTNDLLTIKYETNLEDDQLFSDNKKMYDSKFNDNDHEEVSSTVPLNQKFTGSLEFEKEEIKAKTRRFNEESKDVLEDIKISQKQQQSKTRFFQENKPNFETDNLIEDEYMTKEFLSEIKETYAMRKALNEQIKSQDFAKLTPELQQKVYENYDAADKLIKEIDPEGKYDPSKIKSYTTKKVINNAHNTRDLSTVTKAMVEEDIFENDNTDDFEDTTNDLDTNNFIDDEEISKPYNFNQHNIQDVRYNNQHEYENKNFKQKKSSWRDRFIKKDKDEHLVEEVYGSNNRNDHQPNYNRNQTNYYQTNKYNHHRQNHRTNHYNNNNYEHRNNNYQQQKPNYYENNNRQHIVKNYEPTKNFSNNKTNVVLPQNKQYKTNYFAANNINEPKRIKTMVIKPRSKKNLIEKLYDEAMEDKQIIKEFKDKKSK